MLKAADRISCHQGQRAFLVLNMLRSSLHFKVIVLRAVMSAAFVLAILAHPAQARSYPINGSFETGDFTGGRQAAISRSRRSSQDLSLLVPALLRRERYVTAGPIGSEGF